MERQVSAAASGEKDAIVRLPFAGLKVLDLSRVLAGPYCCALLGEAGASVVKVERPGAGDENRRWGHLWHGESLDFMNVNRNKRGITVNLHHPEGQEIIRKLAADADVVVESFVPGTMEKFHLDYESLKPLNPRMVYCSISAFGLQGPLRSKSGYDGALQAFSGHMSITGELEGGPVRTGASIIDMGTGITAYAAVTTALLGRQLSGNGQKVSVSLLQTALSLMGSHAAVYLMTGKQPTRAGSGVSHLAPYGAYRTRDSYVVIGTLNEETWHKLCRTLAHEDLMAEPRFANLHARVRHRRELDEILHGVFGAKTTAEWVDVFEEAGLVISPVNTLSEVMDHPQVVENGIIVSTQHPAGELKLVGAPMTFANWTLKPTSPPPLLGQHTNEVLQQLGYTLESIAALRSNGVI